MKNKLYIITIILLVAALSMQSAAAMGKGKAQTFPYQVYVNGTQVQLNDIVLNNNKTYVGLREFCEKAGMKVEWVNPKYHYAPIPGGNFPGGVNIINPSFVYVKDVTNFYKTDQKIKGVDITGIYKKYKEGGNYKYYFADRGLVINDGQEKKVIKLKYNISNEYMYVSVDEFREKIQPYFIDICMQ